MDDDPKQSDQFNASLPLPIQHAKPKPHATPQEPTGKKQTDKAQDYNPAADLIRKKVAAAYGREPSAQQEGADLHKIDSGSKLSKHQKFIFDLTSSGKPLREIQGAWHNYYAELPDHEKQEVWDEFYNSHAAASHYASAASAGAVHPAATTIDTHAQQPIHHRPRPAAGTIHRASAKRAPAASPFKSLMFGFSVGTVVLVIFLFSFFNERFIAPFIQPSRNSSSTPIIATGAAAISANPELIIPKINVQIPIIYATDNSDNTIENDLEGGVVHYADTAMPGQDGNLVIFGHSSNNIFNPGRYKFAFVLLSRLSSGDTFYIDNGGHRYTYQVYQKEIVSPTDVSVLELSDKPATATLITCDPPGTSTNRLVVSAEQIDPSPAGNSAATTNAKAIDQTSVLPGNSPTLWSRLVKWFSE